MNVVPTIDADATSPFLAMSLIDDEFLTVAEIAAILKINQQTVRNWIDRGELPAVRVGARRVRIPRSDRERFLEQGRTKPPPEREPSPAQAFWDGELPESQLGPADNG